MTSPLIHLKPAETQHNELCWTMSAHCEESNVSAPLIQNLQQSSSDNANTQVSTDSSNATHSGFASIVALGEMM